MADLNLGEKTVLQQATTNTAIHLDIRGQTQFAPPAGGGQRLLSLYANIWLPKPTSAARNAIARGGWRAWFEQRTATEPDGWDETGFLGPIAIPAFGDMSLLISHSWPHGVDVDPWRFVVQVLAFDAVGKPVSVPLTIGTRNVKMIDLG